MSARITIELHGRIWRDAETGYYLADLTEWDQCTNAPTLDQLMAMTRELVDSHLVDARKLGVLERELRKAGLTTPVTSGATFRVNLHLAIDDDGLDVKLAS